MMTLLVGRRPPTSNPCGFRGHADRPTSRTPEAPQTERIVPNLEQRLSAESVAFPGDMGAMPAARLLHARGNQSTGPEIGEGHVRHKVRHFVPRRLPAQRLHVRARTVARPRWQGMGGSRAAASFL